MSWNTVRAMTTVTIPDYQTDAFFGLEDKWIETAPGELTHYHELLSLIHI